MDDQPTFYIVWSPTGATNPQRRHSFEDAALTEAKRLALSNPEMEFIVLQAIASAKSNLLTITKFDIDLPF